MAAFYWINQGRLGNLLFQYAAIAHYTTASDRVYSFHNPVFELLEAESRFIPISSRDRPANGLRNLVDHVASVGERIGMFGSISAELCLLREHFPVESDRITKIAGLLRRHFVVRGFFQEGRFREIPIRIRPKLAANAKQRLISATVARIKVAVHIRLTDYGNWSVLGETGALISAAWYRDRMDELRRRLASPTFVVFSDDIAATRELKLGDDVVYFQGGSALDDFAAIALCEHAIISPSTFAWWSALVNQRPDKIVMAPTFWAGFKSRTWVPPAIMTDGVEYYPVE